MGVCSQHFVASDGTDLHYLQRLPQHRPVALLIYLHGIAGHAAWFAETAAALSHEGIGVFALDRRGSGRSGGPRGHLARFEQAVADVRQLIELVTSTGRERPLFLAASSWAAKLAVLIAAAAPDHLTGLVLIGPGLIPRIGLRFRHQVEVLLAHRTAPTFKVPIPLLPEHYTHNPGYLNYIREDPLRLRTATARFFWETRRLDRARARATAALPVPLLVQIGEDDVMMDVAATRRWFLEAGSVDKTCHIYPGARHTLDFEPDPSRYRADLIEWIVARATSPAPVRPAQVSRAH